MLDSKEALGLGRVKEGARKRGKSDDIREEYYVSFLALGRCRGGRLAWRLTSAQRLAGQGDRLDEWEPKRVKRLPGEPDGTFD